MHGTLCVKNSPECCVYFWPKESSGSIIGSVCCGSVPFTAVQYVLINCRFQLTANLIFNSGGVKPRGAKPILDFPIQLTIEVTTTATRRLTLPGTPEYQRTEGIIYNSIFSRLDVN